MSTSHPVSQSWQTLTLKMQREPQRGDGPEWEDRGGVGWGGPSLHKEKLPQPQIVARMVFRGSVWDLILIVFLSLVLAVLMAPQRRGRGLRREVGTRKKGLPVGPGSPRKPELRFKGMW